MPPRKAKAPVSVAQTLQAFSFKRRPGPEQVKLNVEINVPASWFSWSHVTAAERVETYRATAVQYEERHVFEPASRGRSAVVEKAIQFVVAADAAENAEHAGYWMRLDQWDRYRNDTYKDDPKGEEAFLPLSTVAEMQAPASAPEPTVEKRPPVYEYFIFLKDGKHVQNDGKSNEKELPCQWWVCKNKEHGTCKGKEDAHKVIAKATTGLLRHVKLCFGAQAWIECKLGSTHSKTRRAADGSIIETYSFKVRICIALTRAVALTLTTLP